MSKCIALLCLQPRPYLGVGVQGQAPAVLPLERPGTQSVGDRVGLRAG